MRISTTRNPKARCAFPTGGGSQDAGRRRGLGLSCARIHSDGMLFPTPTGTSTAPRACPTSRWHPREHTPAVARRLRDCLGSTTGGGSNSNRLPFSASTLRVARPYSALPRRTTFTSSVSLSIKTAWRPRRRSTCRARPRGPPARAGFAVVAFTALTKGCPSRAPRRRDSVRSLTEPASALFSMVATGPFTVTSCPPRSYVPSSRPAARSVSEMRIMRSSPNMLNARRTMAGWMHAVGDDLGRHVVALRRGGDGTRLRWCMEFIALATDASGAARRA